MRTQGRPLPNPSPLGPGLIYRDIECNPTRVPGCPLGVHSSPVPRAGSYHDGRGIVTS